MTYRNLFVLLTLLAIAGCSAQGGTMAPVEDRTGSTNTSANYGNQVVKQQTSPPAKTQAYVAPPSSAPVSAPVQRSAVNSPPVQSNSAATSLATVADEKIKTGQYDQAEASLERALRHDGKNASIWSKLAEVRLLQGNYPQAETTALKSNALANGNKPIMAKNWRMISKSRRLRGDSTGADEAEVRAYQLSK